MTQSLKSTKYLYLNDSKLRCQIFFSSHNNTKQPRQNLVFYVFIEPDHGYNPGRLTYIKKNCKNHSILTYIKKIARIIQNLVKSCDFAWIS
jgi:hypothetical protein